MFPGPSKQKIFDLFLESPQKTPVNFQAEDRNYCNYDVHAASLKTFCYWCCQSKAAALKRVLQGRHTEVNKQRISSFD